MKRFKLERKPNGDLERDARCIGQGKIPVLVGQSEFSSKLSSSAETTTHRTLGGVGDIFHGQIGTKYFGWFSFGSTFGLNYQLVDIYNLSISMFKKLGGVTKTNQKKMGVLSV